MPINRAPQATQLLAGSSLWHVVESTTDPTQRPAILRGTRSLWCGEYSPCFVNPVGYPDLGYEVLYVDTGTHSSNYVLNLCMITSTEYFYDYLYLIGGGGGATDPIGNDSGIIIDEVIFSGSSGNARLLVTWTGSIHGTTPGASNINTTSGAASITDPSGGQPESLSVSITIEPGHRALYFLFRSDCLYSSQDGLWPYGTGALLDDLITSDNGAIYTDQPAAGGTDAFGGTVLVGTSGAPVISSRGFFTPEHSPPTLTPPANQTNNEGDAITLTATATDPEGDIRRVSAAGYPYGLTLTNLPSSATVSGTLSCAAAGSPYTITWCATSYWHEVSATTVLTVVTNPNAPVVSAPPTLRRAVGSVVAINVSASDPDGDAISSLTADLTALPPGNAAFSAFPGNTTGLFTWSPQSGNEGNYIVRFTASNALQGCRATLIQVVPPNATGVALDERTAPVLSLDQNRPNPFNPATSIHFSIPRETRVQLEVYDVRGRRVAELIDRLLPAGPREAAWDGRDANGRSMSSGVYVYRIRAAGASLCRRMVLLR